MSDPKRAPGAAPRGRFAAWLIGTLLGLSSSAALVAAEPALNASLAARANVDPGCTTATGSPPAVALATDGVMKLLDSTMVQIPIMAAPMRGPLTARVTIVEFSDFQCPSCAAASHVLDSVMTAFPRDVRVVFKQFPLDMHPHSFEAAEASLAAADQDKFWLMHDQFFAHQEEIDRSTIMGWACAAGLDVTAFSRGLYAGMFRQRVKQDIADGDRLQVQGTPTWFVNGRRYQGRRVLSELGQLVAALIARPDAVAPPATATGRGAGSAPSGSNSRVPR